MRSFLSICLFWSLSQATEYGGDCSWPIFSTEFSCNDQLGDRASVYHDYMEKCREYAGPKGAAICDTTESDRLEMNARQPMSMMVRVPA